MSKKDILEGLAEVLKEKIEDLENQKSNEKSNLDKFVEAIHAWSESTKRTVKILELQKQARAHFSAGRYQTAARTYIELAELNPKNRDFYLQQAQEALKYSN